MLMGVGLIIWIVGSRDGSCKFCSQNLYRGECLGCLNGSYGPVYVQAEREQTTNSISHIAQRVSC